MTYTAQQVQQAVKDYGIGRWKLRTCSICDTPIGYLFSPDGEQVVFSSACDCSSSSRYAPPDDSNFEVVAHCFNMQTTPGIAEKMWAEFIASGTRQPAPKPIIHNNGTSNPLIEIPRDRLTAWLRTIADEAGFADREHAAVQVAFDDEKGGHIHGRAADLDHGQQHPSQPSGDEMTDKKPDGGPAFPAVTLDHTAPRPRAKSMINYRAMWEYFAFHPVSLVDFVTFKWVNEMRRRASWPRDVR